MLHGEQRCQHGDHGVLHGATHRAQQEAALVLFYLQATHLDLDPLAIDWQHQQLSPATVSLAISHPQADVHVSLGILQGEPPPEVYPALWSIGSKVLHGVDAHAAIKPHHVLLVCLGAAQLVCLDQGGGVHYGLAAQVLGADDHDM